MNSVLGQPGAISVIERAMADGRKHHAWIFYGPRGVGKFTTALQFAKIIIGQPETKSVHPDIHVICKEDVAWSQNPALQRRKQTNIPHRQSSIRTVHFIYCFQLHCMLYVHLVQETNTNTHTKNQTIC